MTSLAAPSDANGLRAAPLLAVCAGFFLVVLDTTVLNVALPDIARHLGGGTAALQWIVNAYTVVLAGLVLTGGALGDRFGARRVYLAGLAVFTAASVLCSAAGGTGVLLAARALQGVGAALLLPTSVALITLGFPGAAARSRALGVWGAVAGVAFAGGPLLGGLLTGTLGWRSLFLLNVPVGLWALWAVWRFLGNVRPERCGAFDLPGQGLAMLALAGLTFGLIEAGDAGFRHPAVWAALALSLAGFVGFVVRERATRFPMLPLDLFRAHSFARGALAGFTFNFGEYGLLFVLALVFQETHGLSALRTGLAFLPLTVVSAAATLAGGALSARLGPRTPLMFGLALMGLGIAGMAVSVGTLGAPFWIGMVVFGLGSGTAVPPMTALALGDVPNALSGVGAAALNAARQTGSVVGVAALGALLAAGSAPALPLAIAALVCLAGAASVWGVSPLDPNRNDSQ